MRLPYIPAHWWLLIQPLAFVLAGGLIALSVFPLTFLFDRVDYGMGDRAVAIAVSLGALLYALITGWLLFRHWTIQKRNIIQ